MALDPRAAMLKINQERMDVQKGLAASQADIGRKMTKKGTKGAIGSWLGQLAAPVLADWGTTALLNVFAPGLGSLYKAAKGVPLLKAGAKGLLTAYGGAKGGEMGAGSVSIGESEDLMKKYMAGTVSGEKGMRFDRGATESMEEQKKLQLEALSDLMKVDAGKAGLKAAGSSLLGDLKTASEARRTGEAVKGTDAASGVSERLKNLRETQGELTTQDYMSAFTESGKQAKKDLLSTQSLKDWSAKREGLTFGQAMKYSDEALTSPALPTVPKVDMEYMNQQLGDFSQPTRIAGEGLASGEPFLQVDALGYTPENTKLDYEALDKQWNQESLDQVAQHRADYHRTDLDIDNKFGPTSDPSGPGQGYAVGSPYYNKAMEGALDKKYPTESNLLGVPFNKQSPSAPSGQLKLPGIGSPPPLGYEKMMSDIYQNPSLQSPQRPLYGSPITKPTFEQAPSQNLLMQNIFGGDYYNRLRGGNY